MLDREMLEYQKHSSVDKAKDFYIMKAMHGFMDGYYQSMRNEIGIDANFGIQE